MHNSLVRLELEKPQSVQRQIYNHLREVIVSGEMAAGTPIPAAQQLAATWNTSTTTVHQALFRLLKEGLLVRTPRNGTFVRQREQKLTCVGVYGSAGCFHGSLYEQAVQAALKEELTAAGIEMDVWLDPRPLAAQGEPWMPLVRAAEHREFQALIATSTDLPHIRWQSKLPVSTVFQTSANVPTAVRFDMTQLAEASVRALAQQGCQSVGLIAPFGPTDGFNLDGSRHVYAGFYERLLDRIGDLGLTVKNEWMHFPSSALPDGKAQEQFGYEAFLQLWSQPEKPAGLIVYPDTMARGVILALREKQVRVPEELKLVLHKNKTIGLFCPMPATFVVSSERAIARALIGQIQKQLRGERCEPISISFDVESNAGR